MKAKLFNRSHTVKDSNFGPQVNVGRFFLQGLANIKTHPTEK
jgi:hypothetical protein